MTTEMSPVETGISGRDGAHGTYGIDAHAFGARPGPPRTSAASTVDAGPAAAPSARGRVLVVEDEPDVRDLISLHLRREGLDALACATAEEGQRAAEVERFALIILDWMLPGMSGVDFAKRLRASESPSAETSILMVTAKAEAADIVEGLESGADDYVTKPFEPSVLVARVRALMRRRPANSGDDEAGAHSASSTGAVRLGQLEINPETYETTCAGEAISLTPSEFKLLLALAQNRGRVLTRDSLIQCVQGEGVSVVGRTVDTHVFGLRKKLGACADAIETVRGVGYRVKAGEI